jgi:hypothetical protein
VPCVQDTTEADDTGKTDIQCTGPLNYETAAGCTCIRRLPSLPIGCAWDGSMSTAWRVSRAVSDRTRIRPDRVLPDVEVTAILATEPHPPAGEEPVEWLLLTNLPVDTPEQAVEKLQWYLCRWQLEIFFRILKSGCRIEELQLEGIETSVSASS